MNLTPYLFFKGNCREAMSFYKDCFGGKLEMMRYGDHENCPPGAEDRIMHAYLSNDRLSLMASDVPEGPLNEGSNVQISVECESIPEVEKLFEGLSIGGAVNQPLHDAFWGARFGMLKDRYGIYWMLSCPLKASS